MANKIQIKRGNKEDMPMLTSGEIAINFYDNNFYVGREKSGNIKFYNSQEIDKKLKTNYLLLSEFKNENNSWDNALDLAIKETEKMNGGKIFIDNDITLIESHKFDITKTVIESYYRNVKYTGYNPLFDIFSSKQDNPYSQNRVIFKGIIFEGNKLINDFIHIDNKIGGVGTSRIVIKDCSFKQFNTVFTFVKNSYATKIENCEIFENKLCIKIIDGGDTGENFSVDKSTLFNNAQVVYLNNQNCDLRFNLCSIDYNWENIITIDKGRVYIENCHIEHSREFHSTIPFVLNNNNGNMLTINDSEIIFLGDIKMKYVFENNSTFKKGGIFLDNNFMYGLSTTTDFIGKGQIEITNTKSFDWENNSKFTSLEMNLFEDYKFFTSDLTLNNIFIDGDGKELDWNNPLNGQNLSVGIAPGAGANNGNNALLIKKKSETQTFARVNIAIPIPVGGLGATMFKIKNNLNQTVPVDVHLGYCKINKSGIAYKGFSSHTYQINKNYSNISMGSEYDRKCPVGYTHFSIRIDLFNAPPCDICIDEIIVTSM